MNRTRRDAIALGLGMAGAAGLAAWLKPLPAAVGRSARLDLDRVVPERFGAWRIDEASRAFVRAADRQGRRYRYYDQVLERTFVDDAGRRIMLCIAFGAEQSSSLQLHRPEVCYRANGYAVRDLHGANLALAGRAVPAMRLDTELPGRREPVTYWTVLGGEVVADAGAFRWRRLAFAARRELADGLLVRVSSIDADRDGAWRLQARFADELLAALAPSDRARLAGPATA